MTQTKGTIRIASAYVTDTLLMSGMEGRDLRLLTYLSTMDIIAGASSLDSLTKLIAAGVQCRYISKGPRLHAKVYLFDDQSAVVTSANLTRKALDSNLEVGVHLSGTAATPLIGWFDMLWNKADKLDLAIIDQWLRETEEERTEYSVLRKRIEKHPLLSVGPATKLLNMLDTGKQFFVCNTNRRRPLEDEKHMYDRGYAAAWEKFHYPDHMGKVEKGDAIFMYAKGVGFIGIGQAKSRCLILEPGDPDRVTSGNTREWRVPVVWLAWNENSAYQWKSQNSTFFEVSGDQYIQLRNDIKNHFLSL